MLRRYVLITLVCALWASALLAQSGGQLWVRAFEDRNANGARDAGEPFLTRGVSVNLLDQDGVTIASALLDDSPNAAQGLVGFQLLPPGQYSVVITSADYEATGESTFTATVSDAGIPDVLEFGAQPIEIAVTPAADAGAAATESRLLAAAAAAVAVMCGMSILGFIIYAIALRGRMKSAQAQDLRTTTGSMRPVPATGTGEYRQTDTDRFRPKDTGPIRVGDGDEPEPSHGTGEFPRP